MKVMYIILFGILGVLARYYGGIFASKLLPPSFPYGTFIINILGAFLIGMVYVLGVERNAIPVDVRIGIMVGFLGGFTTFSSYCLDAVQLMEEAHFATAGLYFVLSPILGGIGTIAGIHLARGLLSSP